MRNIGIFGMLFFFALSAFSQDTIYLDKQKRWIDDKDKAHQYCIRKELGKNDIEVTFYNMGDTLLRVQHYAAFTKEPKGRILHGESVLYYANGQPSEIYHDQNGKRHGKYQRFYEDGQLKYECLFIEGKRERNVKMYYPNGALWRIEQFSKGRSMGGHVFDESGKEADFYPSERNGFPGGSVAMLKFIAKHFHYPKEAVREKAQGKVIIELKFDEEGHIKSYEILPQSIEHPLLRKEAARLVEEDMMPLKWERPVQFGEFRNSVKFPIVFRIRKS